MAFTDARGCTDTPMLAKQMLRVVGTGAQKNASPSKANEGLTSC